MDFLTIEITSKKVRGKNVDLSTSKITSKKVHVTMWIFQPLKLHGKGSGSDVEILRNLVLEYQRNIQVESTWNRWGVPIGYVVHQF